MAFLTPAQAVLDHPTFGVTSVVPAVPIFTTRTIAQAVLDHPTFGMNSVVPGVWPHTTRIVNISGGSAGGSVGYAT